MHIDMSIAVTGIGSKNIVSVPVDHTARMDADALDALLQKHLDDQHSVYAVVAIMGSTEQGAVDPLSTSSGTSIDAWVSLSLFMPLQLGAVTLLRC